MHKKNLNKDDIVNNLSQVTGYSLNFSKKLINDLIKILTQNINLRKTNLKNFGSFQKILKKKRVGRNPLTKEEFIISSRQTLKFTPSTKLKKTISDYNDKIN